MATIDQHRCTATVWVDTDCRNVDALLTTSILHTHTSVLQHCHWQEHPWHIQVYLGWPFHIKILLSFASTATEHILSYRPLMLSSTFSLVYLWAYITLHLHSCASLHPFFLHVQTISTSFSCILLFAPGKHSFILSSP
jgi:hypothetical protein